MPNILIHDPPCMLPLSSKLERHFLKHLEEEWLKLCCHLNDDHWMMVFLWWWKRETCSTTRHMYHTYICDRFRHLKSTRYGFHLVFTFGGMFIFHFDIQLYMQAFFFCLGIWTSLVFTFWGMVVKFDPVYWCTGSSSYGNFMRKKFPIIFQIVACLNLVANEAIAQWACCLLGTQSKLN